MLALGYRPDAFQDAYPDGRCAGVDLHYAVEPEPLDTAGAIRFAAARRRHRRAVPRASTATCSPTSTSARWSPSTSAAGAEGTIALHRVEDPSAFGVVPTDADGRVEAFIEKPPPDEAPTDLINAGTYVLEPSVLDRIAPDVPVNVERETFPAMVADGTLFALDGDTYWIDAGTPATYLAAKLDLLDGAAGAPSPASTPTPRSTGAVDRRGGSAPAPRSGAAPSCRALGASSPGRSSAPAPVVRDSIVGAGAAVGPAPWSTAAAVARRRRRWSPAGAQLHGVRIPEAD